MALCSDTERSIATAIVLGARVIRRGDTEYEITGGLNPVSESINTGESGLATRLFTPIAALCDREITICGEGSMLKRPVGMMEEPLRNLGVEVRSEGGRLPITVKGPVHGGESFVDGSLSSQFISGLLLALPLADRDTVLHIGELNSIPYIDMTLEVAKKFGIMIEHEDYRKFHIRGSQKYTPVEYSVEGDWSAASCILVAGAIAGEVTLTNLNPFSLQADVAILDALERAGAGIAMHSNCVTAGRRELRAFEFDATHCPDLFPALAALAAYCKGTTVIKGVSRLTHKESNRADALASEFDRMGIDIQTDEEFMKIRGGEVRGAVVNSHNDHRIAMATAVAALGATGKITIEGAEAVGKSYPSFWNDLDRIT